jgi:hypothetical protein
MSAFQTPVAHEKVRLIKALLADPGVYVLWRKFTDIDPTDMTIELFVSRRAIAFKAYAVARDKFLGLPLLSSQPLKN